MTVKVITFFSTLCILARAEYEAKLSGNIKQYEEAKLAHDEYKKLCLTCDEMVLPYYHKQSRI
jgi:hypothetical protein